jgi:hypothetical protein
MIDLRLATVEQVIAEVRGAALIVADPNWTYDLAWVNGAAGKHYELGSMPTIRENLANAFECASKDSRLVMWATWPKLGDWMRITAGHPWPWGALITGGAWLKTDGNGMGFHWRGDSEPVLVYKRGAPYTNVADMLSNGHASPRSAHSEKPADWMRGWLRRWTQPGDLVLDLYAGRAPLAHACAAEGRNYIGAEADPERHAEGIAGLMSAGLVRTSPAVRQVGMFGTRL